MIAIVDYGMGNLRSVSKAVEHLGGKYITTDRPEELDQADKIILPGVGAFGDAMKELRFRELDKAVIGHIHRNKPFLGICLGLQLLFEASEESPEIPGMGVLKGTVRRFKRSELKVPHMGWNSVKLKQNPIFDGIQNESFFYFVHTYYAIPDDTNTMIGSCIYGDEVFAAIVGRDNIYATQFHPEKSQSEGIKILKNFLNI